MLIRIYRSTRGYLFGKLERHKNVFPPYRFSPNLVKKYGGVTGLSVRPTTVEVKPSARPNQANDHSELFTSSYMKAETRVMVEEEEEEEATPKHIQQFKYNLKTTPAFQLFGPAAAAGTTTAATAAQPPPKVNKTVSYAQIDVPPSAPPQPQKHFNTTSTQTAHLGTATFGQKRQKHFFFSKLTHPKYQVQHGILIWHTFY